tara:strand:+ start:701 stop:994 length:294 start_codon:yes stop_codon:yes gene_type:complete
MQFEAMAKVAVGQASAQQGSFVMIRIAQQTKPPVPADCVDSHVIPWIRPVALRTTSCAGQRMNWIQPTQEARDSVKRVTASMMPLVVLTNFVCESVL